MPERQFQTSTSPAQRTAQMVAQTEDKGALALAKLARDTKLAARRRIVDVPIGLVAEMVAATAAKAPKTRADIEKRKVEMEKAKAAQQEREDRLGPEQADIARREALQEGP
ncbi:hypothetical protein XPA_001960 [Xanthoria parietina]